jgi:hypothetical protein
MDDYSKRDHLIVGLVVGVVVPWAIAAALVVVAWVVHYDPGDPLTRARGLPPAQMSNKAASVGSRQHVANSHSGTSGSLDQQDVARFHFGLHRVAA